MATNIQELPRIYGRHRYSRLCREASSGDLSLTGFTLVELLIAIAISSIIFLSIISTYSLTLRTVSQWNDRQEDYYLARNIFRKIYTEVSSLYFISDLQVVSTQEEKTDYSGLEGDEKTLSFYTTVKSLYFPSTCLTKVTYEFIVDEEGKTLLIRKEEPVVNFPIEEDPYFETQPRHSKSYIWADNLKDFNFRYSDGEDWHDSWDIEQTSKVLKSIKIEFVSSNEEKFSTIIYLPMQI